MKTISFIFKAIRKLTEYIYNIFYTPIAKNVLFLNGAEVRQRLHVKGFLKVYLTRRVNLIIGKNCRINSGANHNMIGRQQKNIFWAEGILSFGDNVGMSCSAFICHNCIKIGNDVTIGGNTIIFDTDFHPLDPEIRQKNSLDINNIKTLRVFIEDNVFIGAHTTILKGVTISKNSIVGACSLVTNSIPQNEILGGNPARFLRHL
jgi:acyl-[acyl carrier protein]--UDP-N-acetylglucosamine O-acyltransferase